MDGYLKNCEKVIFFNRTAFQIGMKANSENSVNGCTAVAQNIKLQSSTKLQVFEQSSEQSLK